nr:phage tail protein [uncultured Mediterranean phage uvMED]
MFKIPGVDFGAGPKQIQLNPFKWFGGGGGTATITRGSVQSRQAINIVEVLSEGEIEGFPSAAGLTQGTDAYNKASLKDVFLDKTSVVKPTADSSNITDADFNFQQTVFKTRFGTANQTFIPAISDIETEVGVNAPVTNAASVTRTITESNIDAIRVTIRFNALININEKDGKNLGTVVDVFILITENNGRTTRFDKNQITGTGPGGFLNLLTVPTSAFSVSGKSRSAYARDFRITLREGTVFPIQVTVGRDSSDSTSERVTDTFSWSSLTKIIDEQRPYPNVAHTYFRFDAEQFPSIPRRLYRIRGIKVKIPHNATVDSTNGRLIYSGTFNGTLTTATHWTTDPAWILFDLITNSRYGLGEHITETQLDKYSFYSASVYASALVDDGEGGQEPRFSCNVVLNKRSDAFKTVMALSSVMRAMTFWGAGSLTITQDRPTDASYLFNLSNVTSEGFIYSGTSLKTRSTVVSVSYFDMTNQEPDFETVEDTAAKNKYGIIHKKITGFGTTSRNQARRLGRFILFEEQNSTETISFNTGISEGVVVRPGQVIEVSDPVRAGLRRGGRISSATTTTITVDNTADTDLDATNNATVSVVMPDGSVEKKDVSNISGAVITVSSAFSSAPNRNSIWILENTTLQTTQWRIVSVNEDKDNYAIVGTAYNSGKFAFIEDGSALPVRNITVLNEPVPAPSAPVVTEEFFTEGNRARTRLNVDFNPVPRAIEYELKYQVDDSNFKSIKSTTPEFEILDSLEGTYNFELVSIGANLESSAQPTTFTHIAVGKSAIPSDVTGLTGEPINSNQVRLRWNLATDIDVTHGGRVYVRHSTKTDGTGTFSNATDLVKALAGNTTEAIVPLLEGEYILKFQDDGGRFSAGEASVVIDLPDNLAPLVALTRREDLDVPKFQGTKTNVAFDAVTNSLNLTGTGLFDAITNFDLEGSIDDIGGIAPLGTYEFGGAAGTSFLDLGGVFSLDLKRHFLTEAFFPSDLFDSISDIDARVDFDGSVATEVNAEMLVAVTQDNPSSGSPTYKEFQTFANGQYKGRGFKFKVNLTSNDVDQDIRVFQLGYTASFQRRTEQSPTTTASGAGARPITFQHPFFTGTSAIGGVNSNLPSIGITAQNMASGDYFELSSVSGTGFTVHFKNSSNASIDRNFTYQAVGFGKG